MRCSMLFGRTTELNQVNTRGVERILRAARTHLIDYTIIRCISLSCWHRVCSEKVHEDEHGLFSFRTVDPRVDCRLGVSFGELGAQEVIGMGASGRSTDFDFALLLDRAVPAMLFVGIFMMPFYYGSRARSVPEYLKLRLMKRRGDSTRFLRGDDGCFPRAFRCTRWASCCNFSGMELYGGDFDISVDCAGIHISGRAYLGDLQRGVAVLPDRDGIIPLVYLGLRDVGGWNGLKTRIANDAMVHSWKYMGHASENRWAWSGSEC